MDKIMIGINFVKFGWIVTVPLVILGIIGDIFNSKIAEFIFAAYCEAKRPDLRSKTVAFRF